MAHQDEIGGIDELLLMRSIPAHHEELIVRYADLGDARLLIHLPTLLHQSNNKSSAVSTCYLQIGEVACATTPSSTWTKRVCYVMIACPRGVFSLGSWNFSHAVGIIAQGSDDNCCTMWDPLCSGLSKLISTTCWLNGRRSYQARSTNSIDYEQVLQSQNQ